MKLVLVGVGLFLAAASHAENLLILGAQVHTLVPGQPLQVTDVLIIDGQVEQLGTGLDVPADTRVIEARGKVVTPGLVAAYSQLGLDELDIEATTNDSKLDANGVGPAFDVQYAFNPASVVVRVNLVEGVTHGVIAPREGPGVLAGFGAGVSYASGAVIAPQLAMYGGVGAAIAPTVGGSRAETIGRLRRTLGDLKQFRAKTYRKESNTYSRHDMQALLQAKDQDLPFVVQAHRANEIRQLLALADEFDLRLIVRGAAEGWQVAAELAAADVGVIIDPLQNLPLSFEQLGARLDNAALLAAAGVKLAIVTSDQHNVRLLRQHAGNAVAHGLDWQTALAAITRSPVELLGLDDTLGRIVPGERANLVVWSGDPLEVSTWADVVIGDGRLIDGSSRQTRLLQRYRTLRDVPATEFKYR